MLKNFFKIAFRNLAAHKGFTAINIAGLTLGLSACILIGLYIRDEKQFDRFLPDGNLVYRIYNEYTNNEGTRNNAVTPPVFTSLLQHDFPEIAQATKILMISTTKFLFENGNTKLYGDRVLYVDSTFFELFPLSAIHGSLTGALNDPASIVLSESMAEKLFGKEDPVGKQLLMEKGSLRVKAVVKEEQHFHLQFDFVIPLAGLDIPAERIQSWGWQQFFTYAKLKPGTNVNALEARFQNLISQKSKTFLGDKTISYKPFFQPLKNIHLYSANLKFDNALRGNITYVNALNIIAVFVLLIACFNFVNLATAKSLQRAKEVGIRKTIGAGRRQLIVQFIGESLLLALISIILAIALTYIFLPWLNRFTNKHIFFNLFSDPLVIISLLALTLVVGLFAGFYPALVLSGFKPVNVLKGKLSTGDQPGRIQWLRHGLVIIQFTLSVLLIICAMIVFEQVNYLHNRDLGFNKEEIMFFPMRGDYMPKHVEAFKHELQQVSGVSSVSIGYGFPGDAVAGDDIIVPRKGERLTQSATQLMVDYDYVRTLGLRVIAGRDFSPAMKTDADHAFIINEKAVKELGFGTPEKAIGQPLYWHPWNAKKEDSLKEGYVIGVIKDFNYKSLYDKMETTILQIYPDAAWKVAIKMKTNRMDASISGIRSAWDKYSPEYPIEYKFLDENFEQLYIGEDKLKSLLWVFTGLAIFVGCLGLLGLTSYAAERRRKEVGIRKVLGASIRGIVILLSKDFIVLVIISLLIASPLAWYFMQQWLQDFPYRISISGWVFVIAALLAMSIALITISFQAIGAARVNPVKSLRTE